VPPSLQNACWQVPEQAITPENFKAAIEKVEAYKAGHPEEAEKCDTELARLQHQLNFVSGGATDP
jgi:hypothetical protein